MGAECKRAYFMNASTLICTPCKLANMAMTLAERLIYAREASGYPKVKPAAERAGITPSALYQLESGKTKALSGDTAQKLASIYLGFRIEWLISGSGPKTSALTEKDVAALGIEQPLQRLRLDPETLAAAIKLVRLTFRNLEIDYDPEIDAVPIVYAYDYLSQAQERVVTPENLVDFSKKLAEKLRTRGTDEQAAGQSGSTGGGNRGAGERRLAG